MSPYAVSNDFFTFSAGLVGTLSGAATGGALPPSAGTVVLPFTLHARSFPEISYTSPSISVPFSKVHTYTFHSALSTRVPGHDMTPSFTEPM